MTDFRPLTTVEGIRCVVNYDDVDYVLAVDSDSSAIYFKGGGHLLVRGALKIFRRDNQRVADFDTEQGTV